MSVSVCHAVLLCQMINFDPWDMLNNFCFHVYTDNASNAESVTGVNGNAFFTIAAPVPVPLTLEVIELVPS